MTVLFMRVMIMMAVVIVMIMAAIWTAIVVMTMIVSMMPMIMVVMLMVVMIMLLDIEEIGLDLQYAVQLEGVLLQHRLERHVGLHGAMQLRIGLMPRMRASTSSSSAGVTRSVLLSTITSANAIWFFARARP